eukprot:GHVR01156182.1.p1 GENE.GHVR01156182.1~~GHVR01156182.1.p1  ORF type:complete len:117 (+),score=8.04 GHVR01156182.1:1818-2168(+)
MHSKNIMHRDLKPDNILLTHGNIIKIGDFGFVRFDGAMDKTPKVGTPIYSDPLIETGTYSKKCDIFSVGLIIYYIFVNTDLFEGCKSLTQLKEKQKRFFKNFKKSIQDIDCQDFRD